MANIHIETLKAIDKYIHHSSLFLDIHDCVYILDKYVLQETKL